MMPRSSSDLPRRTPRLIALAFSMLSLTATGTLAQGEATPGWTHPLHARGVQPQRGAFAVLPWESIDMASGSVTLAVPGLMVPGPNGLDITVRHVITLGDTVTGGVEIGGPVYVYLESTYQDPPGSPNPAIVNDDGSMRSTFLTTAPGVYMTHEYARFTKATRTLETPDGLTYYFGLDVVLGSAPDTATIAYLTSAHGNRRRY